MAELRERPTDGAVPEWSRQRTIVMMRFTLHWRVSRIAKAFGVSTQRIDQILGPTLRQFNEARDSWIKGDRSDREIAVALGLQMMTVRQLRRRAGVSSAELVRMQIRWIGRHPSRTVAEIMREWGITEGSARKKQRRAAVLRYKGEHPRVTCAEIAAHFGFSRGTAYSICRAAGEKAG